MKDSAVQRHLTDDELFSLAAPATGEPEALPAHLSQCQACSRSLQEWEGAIRALADEDAGPIEARTAAEWRRAEDATLELVRRAGRPSRSHPVRWAVGIAATLLLAVLAVPGRKEAKPALVAAVPTAAPASAGMSPADQADDDLLRDATFLAQGADLTAEENL
jgi:hypothetical protein